jgi:hypothetical protein
VYTEFGVGVGDVAGDAVDDMIDLTAVGAADAVVGSGGA